MANSISTSWKRKVLSLYKNILLCFKTFPIVAVRHRLTYNAREILTLRKLEKSPKVSEIYYKGGLETLKTFQALSKVDPKALKYLFDDEKEWANPSKNKSRH
jgi:hypothetical protein